MRITLITALLVSILVSVGAQPEGQSFRIVGYYSLTAALQGGKDAPFKRLTHVNLWFLNPDSLGNFTRDLSGIQSFVLNAHRRDVKVLFSIGGGTRQPQYHWLLKDDQRPMLVRNLVDQVLRYGVDGIDVDLEGSNIDEYYEDFVTELRIALKQHDRLLTSAIAVYYKDQLTDAALAQFDFVNVMSYDRTGPWRPEKPGPHSTYDHAMEDLEYFANVRMIPREKMTLGVPFYGYGYGPELTSKAISMSYGDIVKMFKGSETVDEYKMPDGKMLYYNGIPTMLRKAELARQMASGIMIWQVRGDARGRKSLLRAINKALE